MSLRCGPLFWVVVVPCGGLCCGSGTEGMCIPGGFHHCHSRLSSCFWACLGVLLGAFWDSVLIWPVVFCFVTRSYVWCHGGLGRSVLPVVNVIYLSILVNFKTTADTT